jgi:hypothetical protein
VPYANESRLAEWRREIVKARIKLADDFLPQMLYGGSGLSDCREACSQMSEADFSAQLELIDREIEHELQPRRRA